MRSDEAIPGAGPPAPVVRAEGVGKVYRTWERPLDRVLEAVTGRPRHRSFPALADVSFALPRGEGLGIVGANGAGKSTLLKLLAGITAPTTGRIAVAGTTGAILELGTGFHREFTGRQNIVLNAAMIGLSEDQVRERMPAIEEFSELGPFLDQPLRTYSTGMAMRLAFSIATQVEPDVLIVDEALSVGDGYFQQKCVTRIRRFLDDGGTLVFCSHAMYFVSAFCRRALWLEHGRVAALGDVDDVVRDYERHLVVRQRERVAARGAPPATDGTDLAPAAPDGVEGVGTGAVRIREARVTSGEDEAPRRHRTGEPLRVEVAWEVDDPALPTHVGVAVRRLDEVELFVFATLHDGLPPRRGAGEHRATLEVPDLPLVKGEYTVWVYVVDEAGLHIHDQRVLPSAFRVETPGYAFGLVRVDHRWVDAPADGHGPDLA